MRRHPAWFATVLVAAALAAPLPATATPRKVCNLLPGTKSFTQSRGIPYDHPLVMRSADLASNAKAVTAVIRVKDLADPVTSASGRGFHLSFSRNPEESYELSATVWPTRTTFTLHYVSERFDPQGGGAHVDAPQATLLAEVGGVVDVARDEVRITAPLTAFRIPGRSGSTMKPGARVSYLAATTAALYGADRGMVPATLPDGVYTATGISNDAEWGYDKIAYVLGTPSCVAVGR